MNLDTKINDICKKPLLFGITSSECIYWFLTGHAVAEWKGGERSTALELDKINKLLINKYKLDRNLTNWGLFIKYRYQFAERSINGFKNEYMDSQKYESSFDDTIYLYYVNKLASIDSFYSILQELSKDVDHVLNLRLFISGFEIGILNKGIHDEGFTYFANIRDLVHNQIL